MCLLTARERTQAALSAVAEFAAVASKVQHEELRIASEQVALEGLSLCEGHGRRCIIFMLAALRNAPRAGPEASHDAVWMLYKVARSSDAARAWILEAAGLDVLYAALVEQPQEKELQRDGAWLAYALNGLAGFAGLLCRSASGSTGDVAVRGAVVWSLYDLVQGDVAEDPGAHSRPQAASILALLVQAMGQESDLALDAWWACCSALEAMIGKDPRFCSLLLDHNGAPLLVRALRCAGRLGAEGEDCRQAVANLFAVLAEGSSRAAVELRAAGAVGALVENGLVGSGRDVEAAMWALGHLGGLGSVLEVMAKEGLAKPAVMRGGVLAICDCAWHVAADREELARTPAALRLLLELQERQEERIGLCQLRDFVKTLGSVVACLAPHAPPGRVPDVDVGVEALLARLQDAPALRTGGPCADTEDGPTSCPLIAAAEVAAEALGRVALFAPQWREALRRCGALQALACWIRCGRAPRRLQKYLFWAAAAIAGLPFVAAELRLHIGSTSVVDAGLCTIIDILDDDIDGEYALVGVERGADSDLSSLLSLVIEALRAHQGVSEIQFRGGHCIALLAPLATQAALQSVTPTAVNTVVAAARRFPRRQDVVCSSCAALRSLCSLPRLPGAAEVLTAAMAKEGTAECMEQVLLDFGKGKNCNDLLEDAAATLALLSGVEVVVERITEWPPGCAMRAASLKALFEVCRADMQLLTGGVSASAAAACARVAEEERDNPSSRLHEVATLLHGLCSSVARAAEAAGA